MAPPLPRAEIILRRSRAINITPLQDETSRSPFGPPRDYKPDPILCRNIVIGVNVSMTEEPGQRSESTLPVNASVSTLAGGGRMKTRFLIAVLGTTVLLLSGAPSRPQGQSAPARMKAI